MKSAPLPELRAAELYRRQVRELRDYAMFTMDPEGILTSWNAGVEQLIGYTEAEWIGQHSCIIFTPEEKAAEVCASEMRLAAENGSSSDIRWHRHKDGSLFFANGVMYPVRDQQGGVLGYAKILNDETARKQLEDALTESNFALEQFASVVSHDLQEPLRTMNAYAQLLSRKYQGMLDSEADQFLHFLQSASIRMSDLVRDLLTYAQQANGTEGPASVTLDDDLEAAITGLAQAIQESGATITHDALPVVPADRGQMVRLFQNLVGNAIKYRKPDQPPDVHVSSEKRADEWVISVRDNGIGFDPAYAAAIFEPFKRLHTAAEYPGTGIGLSICRRIVQAHRGRIWAESKPGEGTTFRFTLPANTPHPPRRK